MNDYLPTLYRLFVVMLVSTGSSTQFTNTEKCADSLLLAERTVVLQRVMDTTKLLVVVAMLLGFAAIPCLFVVIVKRLVDFMMIL